MVMISPSSSGALVIDANIAVAISSREMGRDVKANAEMSRYASLGYEWIAPGVIVTETLHALCQKYQAGLLTAAEYDAAALEFEVLMQSILPPPDGDASLIQRAHAIGKTYGCSRSADGVYIALAEELARTRPTVLLTSTKNCPSRPQKTRPQ